MKRAKSVPSRGPGLFCKIFAVSFFFFIGTTIPPLFFDDHSESNNPIDLIPLEPESPVLVVHHKAKKPQQTFSNNTDIDVKKIENPSSESSVEKPRPLVIPQPAKLRVGIANKQIRGVSEFDDKVKKLLMPLLKKRAGVERKNDATNQNLDFQTEDFIDNLYSDKLKFLVSDLGVTCYEMCKREKMHCARDWFLLFNNCDLMFDLFPKAKDCINDYFGRDLPAFRPSTNSILLNSQGKTWLPSCGASHDLTQRVCACEGGGQEEAPTTFHTVYNCQSSPYFDWQARYSYYHFKKSGMPGGYTRLLSASEGDHLMQQVPSFVAPPWDLKQDNYLPYNKPFSMMHWFQNVEVKEDVIVILDPDCFMISKMDIPVKEGQPIAQQGYYFFKDDEPNSVEMQICKHYCPSCQTFDPIAVPIIIHKNDAKKIIPLWVEKIKLIRSEKQQWPAEWTSKATNSLDWVAEMYGYVIAASELRIRHDMWNLQAVPGVDSLMRRPIIHYHTPVKMGAVEWNKHHVNAGEQYVWPVPAGTDEVKTKLMEALKDAHDALGPLDYKWPPNWGYEQAKP